MEYYNETIKRATLKYRKEKCRKITLELNKTIDSDLLVWLDSQENKQGYLKQLIRDDMGKHGFTLKEE